MTVLLELRDVVKHFPVRDALGRRAGAVHAVDGVSLSVAEGEVLAIVGESGCGKSTLGRVMLRLIEPDSGSVRRIWQAFRHPPYARADATCRSFSRTLSAALIRA